MSYKNENHLAFLEGHDDQIQKMDLVKSEIVNENTELEVYDIVLFDNPWIKAVDMHRIVDIREYSLDEINIYNASHDTFHEINTLVLNQYSGGIEIIDSLFSDIQITFLSESAEFSGGYKYSFAQEVVIGNVTSTEKENYYEHLVTIHRDSTAPLKFTVTHNKEFDYTSEHIAKIEFTSDRGEVQVTANEFIDKDDYLQCKANVKYEYQIRGDAAKSSDGWYKKEEIHSRVTKIFPKAGYFFRFINSLPGLLMIIGLGVIILITDFFIDKFNNNKVVLKESGDDTHEKE